MTIRLVADIGGTNVRLALSKVNPELKSGTPRGRLIDGTRAGFLVSQMPDLASCLAQYPHTDFDEAVIAVAGPPINNRIEFTNSPWVIDGNALSQAFGKPFKLINDFEAQAFAPHPNPRRCAARWRYYRDQYFGPFSDPV